MKARLLSAAPLGPDASEHACKGCGQPLGRHAESIHRSGSADTGADEPGTSVPAIREETVTAIFGKAIRNGQRLQRLRHLCRTECAENCPLPANKANSSRVFPCTAEHVSAVRAFTRKRLVGHPARDDAVMVISELAANAAAYSGGRWLLVHVTEVSATHAAVLINERRGSGVPQVVTDADPDAESGRGLAIVQMLSCFLRVCEDGDSRNILAVVPANPPAGEAQPGRARSARRTARRTRTRRRRA